MTGEPAADDRQRGDGEQEVVALEPAAQREEVIEARPVEERQSHRADAELVEGQGQVGVGPGQQVDAVAAEHRHVPFVEPQHRVDTDTGSAAVVGGGIARQSWGQPGMHEQGVAGLDANANSLLGSFELVAGDHVVRGQP